MEELFLFVGYFFFPPDSQPKTPHLRESSFTDYPFLLQSLLSLGCQKLLLCQSLPVLH